MLLHALFLSSNFLTRLANRTLGRRKLK